MKNTAIQLTSVAALMIMLAACGDSGSSRACTPGTTKTCDCVGGGSGVQACNAAGSGYDTCVCSGLDLGGDTTVDSSVDTTSGGDTTVDSPSFSDTTVDGGGGADTTVDGGGGTDTTVDGGAGADSSVDGPSADATVDSGSGSDSTVDGASGGVGLHGNCSTQQCAQGLVCVSYDTTQPPVCYQDCTSNANVCASNTDGRNTCRAVNSTTSICAQQIATSGACNLALSRLCMPFDDCVNGTCTPLPRANRFEPCAGNTGSVCDPASQVCVTSGGGLTHGHCFDQCNPSTATCTTNGAAGQCITLTTSGGACVPNGSLPIDSVCGQDEGQNYSGAKDCGPNLLCLTFTPDAVKGVCLQQVANCTGTPCTTGRTCLPLTSGAGACAQDCSSDPTICTNNGKNCAAVTTTDIVCTPAGTRTFTQSCTASTLCAPNLTCLSATAQSAQGYCTPQCTTGTCPTTPAGSVCDAITAQLNLCVFDCTNNPSVCTPFGMQCLSTGSGSICLFP